MIFFNKRTAKIICITWQKWKYCSDTVASSEQTNCAKFQIIRFKDLYLFSNNQNKYWYSALEKMLPDRWSNWNGKDRSDLQNFVVNK